MIEIIKIILGFIFMPFVFLYSAYVSLSYDFEWSIFLFAILYIIIQLPLFITHIRDINGKFKDRKDAIKFFNNCHIIFYGIIMLVFLILFIEASFFILVLLFLLYAQNIGLIKIFSKLDAYKEEKLDKFKFKITKYFFFFFYWLFVYHIAYFLINLIVQFLIFALWSLGVSSN